MGGSIASLATLARMKTSFNNGRRSLAVVAHTFYPSTWEAETGGFLSLVYKVSSRTARTIQRNPVSKNKTKKTKQNKKRYMCAPMLRG